MTLDYPVIRHLLSALAVPDAVVSRTLSSSESLNSPKAPSSQNFLANTVAGTASGTTSETVDAVSAGSSSSGKHDDPLCSPAFVELFENARAVRDSVYGREVFLRGVVEFSNVCRKNCLYCGLRAGNRIVERFRLTQDDILDAVELAVSCGMGTVVLQSGEDFAGGAGHVSDAGEDTDHRQWNVQRQDPLNSLLAPQDIGELVRKIKTKFPVAVTLSLGDHDEESYRLWRDCGADRYLLKLETTDEALHARMRPGQTVAERLKRVELLQRLGFETGSGIITGLPGMTPEILARDILTLSSLGLSMLAAGPFIPHAGTPLGRDTAGRLDEALAVTAMLRLLNSQANIPATSALDALVSNGREQGLAAGANVVMPSVTPPSVRKKYAIYPGKNAAELPVRSAVDAIKERLHRAGYTPSTARGDSFVER